RSSEIQQALFESLASQRFLRQWGGEGYAMRRFDEKLEVNRELNVRTMLLNQMLARATVLITNAAQVAVLIVGGLIVVTSAGQSLSPGGLMAFYVLLLRLYAPAGSLAGALQSFIQAADALGRLRNVLDLAVETDPGEAVELAPLRAALRFEEVRLARPNGSLELASPTAEVPAGSNAAFVGPTGSGKASLLGLLSRFDEPSGGVIRWDGTDIRLAR